MHARRYGVLTLLTLWAALFPALAVPRGAGQEIRNPASFRYGDDPAVLREMEARVARASEDPAARAAIEEALIETVRFPKTTPEARRFACRLLGFVGSERAVPALARLLEEESLVEDARFGLERIPGKEAGEALKRALSRLEGRALAGVMESLAARREAGSVAAVAGRLRSSDALVRRAAVRTLGRIGAPGTEALLDAEQSGVPVPRVLLHEALLRCAHDLADRGEAERAEALFRRLRNEGASPAVRRAAFLGAVELLRARTAALVEAALRGGDPVQVEGAAAFLARPENEDLLRRMGRNLAEFPEKTRRRLGETLLERFPEDADLLRRLAKEAGDPGIRRSAALELLERRRTHWTNLAAGARADSPDGIERDGDAAGDGAAVDGDPATYWDETDGKPEYRLRLSFDRPRTVSALRILGWRQEAFAPRDFLVIVDGVTVKTVHNARYRKNVLWVTLPETSCRVLELRITGYYGRSPAVRELELYHPPAEALHLLEGKGDGPPPSGEAGRDAGARVETGASALPGKRAFSWERSPEGTALRCNGRTVWRLVLDGKLGKAYFHPVALMDGTSLTWLSPPDHPWHRSLWFSWKYVNGVNYWEYGKDMGRTEIEDARIETGEGFSAEATLRFRWHPPGGDPVLEETRTVRVRPPDEQGRYVLDWEETFLALEKAVLDRTPPPDKPEGKSWGGYAGLSVRLAGDTAAWRIEDSEGRRDLECHRRPARWIGCAFRAGAAGREAGIVLLDHPSNLRHPPPSFVVFRPEVPFVYLGPALLFEDPLVLEKGAVLRLRYRILVHPGPWDRAWIESEWKEFAAAR